MSSILIKNATIVTLGRKNKLLEKSSLLIEDNIIKKISSHIDEKSVSPQKIIDARNRIVMPGFINAHTHFYSSFVRGIPGMKSSTDFLQILENLWWRLDKKLSLDDCYYSTLVSLVDAIKKGATTVFDHHSGPSSIEGSLDTISDAVIKSGVRANLCYEITDRNGPVGSKQGLEENIRFIKKCDETNNEYLKGMMGLHASFTVEEESMERASEAANQLGVGIHIHCAEDKLDQEKCLERYNSRVVDRLYRKGVLNSKAICAHAVHLDDEEWDILKEKDVMVAHNPQSNMNNAVGTFDLQKAYEEKILVGLGTDAMTANMLQELRSCLWSQRSFFERPDIGFNEAVNTLLINNAIIANRYWTGLGELKEGYKADIILVDYFPPTPLTEKNFTAHLFYGISEASIDTTIVNGRILMEKGILKELDEEEIMAKAREISIKLWKKF